MRSQDAETRHGVAIDSGAAGSPAGGKGSPPAGRTLPFAAPRDVRRELELAVHTLNTGSIRSGMFLRFAVDYGENPATVRVIDSKSGETVRRIPWTELVPELDQRSRRGLT